MQDKHLMMRGAIVVPSDLTASSALDPPGTASVPASGAPAGDQGPVGPPNEASAYAVTTSTATAQFLESGPKRPPRRPGGNQQVVAGRKAREDRIAAMGDKAGVLRRLKEMALEASDTAAVQSAKALLEAYAPEGAAECRRLCCKIEHPSGIAKDVREWLDTQHEQHLRGLAATYRERGMCPSCKGPVGEAPAPRTCASFHRLPATVPADEMQRAEDMAAAVHCELCFIHRQQKVCTCRAEEWKRISGEVKGDEDSQERLTEIYRGMNGNGGDDAD